LFLPVLLVVNVPANYCRKCNEFKREYYLDTTDAHRQQRQH